MKSVTLGPYGLRQVYLDYWETDLATGETPVITVKAGDTIKVLSQYGKIDFGVRGLGLIDADGLHDTPYSSGAPGFRAPTCRKYSLICNVTKHNIQFLATNIIKEVKRKPSLLILMEN